MNDPEPSIVRSVTDAATYAVVDRVGARITQFVSHGRPFLTHVQPAPRTPPSIWSGCFAMAPFCGLLPDRTIQFGGRAYEIAPDQDGELVHGLTHDIPWESESATHLAVELPTSWPFGGVVRQRVDVTDQVLTVTVSIENDHRSMPASLGLHPWLSRQDHAGESAALDIDIRSIWSMDDRGLPIRECDLAGAPAPHPLDHQARLHDHPSLHWRGGREPLMDRHAPESLTVSSNTDLFIIYEHDPATVCIEPITSAIGALGSENPPVVEPGAPLRLTMSISAT